MPRNSSGTFSLPSGNPVTTGTAVSSTVHNNTQADIASELTDSLSRSGKGGMSAPLVATAGSVSAPSVTFSGDVDTGIYRTGANAFAASCGGSKVAEFTATGITVAAPTEAGNAVNKTYVDSTDGTVAAGANWTVTNSKCHKSMTHVYGLIAATGATSASTASIATLPAGYRPECEMWFAGVYNDAGTAIYPAIYSVGTDGVVSLYYYDNGTSFATGDGITAAASDYVNFSFSFEIP